MELVEDPARSSGLPVEGAHTNQERRSGRVFVGRARVAVILAIAALLTLASGLMGQGCSSSAVPTPPTELTTTTSQNGSGTSATTQVETSSTTATTSVSATTAPSATVTGSSTTTVATAESETLATFAVIGDYGMDNEHEAAVADLVASWNPDYIITTGDDYYSPAGGKGTGRYDESTGAYYSKWLKDITTTGKRSPVGLAPVNAFFPSLGNHDYTSAAPGPRTYLQYFDLPGAGFKNSSGNERYYDFVQGPIHFFVVNSNKAETDGTSSTSAQALWLKAQLAASSSTWNLVYFHHPPYCSDLVHGSTPYMQWPFAGWGADAVLSGHAHAYERVERDGIVYFVNGLGGADRYFFGLPIGGSEVRFNSDWGAQKVTVTAAALTFEFWSVGGTLVDRVILPARR